MNEKVGKCHNWRNLLVQYSDGTLDVLTSARVKHHIGECSVCQAIVDDFQATCQLLRSAPSAALPVGFEQSLSQRLQTIEALRARRAPWDLLVSSGRSLRPVLAIGAVVAIVGAFLVSGQPRHHAIRAHDDSALISQCIAQHRSDTDLQPLSDWSAQNLASRLDSEATASKSSDSDKDAESL